jgi:SAM-dependent methyltransferase
LGADVDYAAVRERHAWYRLGACDAQHVARLLRQGPEVFWSWAASAYLKSIPWNSDGRFREVLDRLGESAADGRSLRFVELGFGWGTVTGIAAHLGHDAIGVDIDGPWVGDAAELFDFTGAKFLGVQGDFFRPGEQSEVGQADLVFSGDVIEHSPAPRDFLRRAVELVAPGGTLIVTTPAVTGDDWPSGPPPVHVTALPASCLVQDIEKQHPDWVVESWREDLGPDPREEQPPRPRAPARVVDPGSAEYFALASRHKPSLVTGREVRPRPTPKDVQVANAILSGRRRLGTGSVVVARRPADPA